MTQPVAKPRKSQTVEGAKLTPSTSSKFCHCGAEPACYMTGGAGWKMAPHMAHPFELVESLIFDGLLVIARDRIAAASR